MTTAIIDLSALYWRYWHTSDGDDVSTARRNTLACIHKMTDHDDIVIAIDSPPYKRAERYPYYKANRPERSQASIEELRRTIETLLDDGYKIVSCEGYEADDVIATMVNRNEVDIVYATDKDLLQCCDIVDPITGDVKTSMSGLGVPQEYVIDYLALVGDSSDNIPGVMGIGPKKATQLIETFGTVSKILDAANSEPEKFKPATLKSLEAAAPTFDLMCEILELQYDLELNIKQRKPNTGMDVPTVETEQTQTQIMKVKPQIQITHEQLKYKQSLEPIGVDEARNVAKWLFESRLYCQFSRPEAIFAVIMRGRALGIDATTALDSIDVIQGKPTMSAQLIAALVMKDPNCEYLYCDKLTYSECTWITKRRNNPEEQSRTFTIEEADRLKASLRWDKDQKKWVKKDNWAKQPHVMLQWRCVAALCRQVYPDVLKGIYATEEFDEGVIGANIKQPILP